jgi:uncharacterized membrane protein AbrB (regulator of aidB expression)
MHSITRHILITGNQVAKLMITKMPITFFLGYFMIGYMVGKEGYEWSDIPTLWQAVICVILSLFVAADLADYFLLTRHKKE